MTSQNEQTDDVKVFFCGKLIRFHWEAYDRLVATDAQGQYSAFSSQGWQDFVLHIGRQRPAQPAPTVPHEKSTAIPPVGGNSGCACACHDKGPIQPGCSACAASPFHQQVVTRYRALSGSL